VPWSPCTMGVKNKLGKFRVLFARIRKVAPSQASGPLVEELEPSSIPEASR
jgi:hypothetical protein